MTSKFTFPRQARQRSMRIRSAVLVLPMLFWMTTCFCVTGNAENRTLLERAADSAIQRWPEGQSVQDGSTARWTYDLGTLLGGMDALWYDTADGAYYGYIKRSMDALVAPDGSIPAYHSQEHSLDNLLLGRQLLLLYRVTRQEKYYRAASLLRQQIASQPRNTAGGFWHKQIYPDQMWLDGLYMAEPFYAEYASVFQEPQDFADITKQFVLVEEHARDPKTGLFFHAWDASRKQGWADKTTGLSSIFWARGMGWYMMALADTLPYYPKDDPGRARLLAIFNRMAAAMARYQDRQTGLWYQVIDRPRGKGNYLESSAACMFTYALAKGARLGYLPAPFAANAARAWQGITSHFIQEGMDGAVNVTGTVKSIGLGGVPYRDGSYSYYVSAPVASNDQRGVGAFLLAGSEMRMAPVAGLGRGKRVMVDAWFNSQQRVNAAGQTEFFHYKWSDFSNDGFSLFGHIFRSYGVATETLYSAPTVEKLKDAQFYIIASPDIPIKNPRPHYVQPEDAEQVARWVKQGGVLLLMENDPANADIDHLDQIADRFGIHFNEVLSHHVAGHDRAPGRIFVQGKGPLFHSPHLLYMKDTCTISLKGAAVPLVQDQGAILMASAKYGKGTVFAVADPWVYNEYTDGRNLPPEYENFAGGMELGRWLLQQVPRGPAHSLDSQ
ncbi:MAG TPA: glycoside hydrolase family 88 protein [Acidobacteriaceae bacterium]|nr:glycoside hydrolase family 88 protein [Acidobacteriaceae bacterium]